MEKLKATIIRKGDSATLQLHARKQQLAIVLTEDNPNAVKNVFNKLLIELKKGLFQFELDAQKEDLYFHICKEYITHLNTEMKAAFKEMEEYELVTPGEKK